MILADKIIEERKRMGWSQEELAEKLEVSRQAVSKWEGAQSIPDINRIIQMAEIFGVTTDYLLKDDALRDETNIPLTESDETKSNVRKVSMEEAADFLSIRKKQAPKIANGVSLCILSPVILIVLAGVSDAGLFGISENFAGGFGVVTLLVMVAIAVFQFIQCGNENQKYEFLQKEEIETSYGVDGMAREKRTAYEGTYNRYVAVGVILCILCSVPLLIASFMTEKDAIITSMVGVLLIMVSVAVNMFVRVGTVKAGYDMLLQENDYTIGKKKQAPLLERVGTIYWLSAVAIYLAVSFLTNRWEITWVVWPVAGVLYGVIAAIAQIAIRAED